MAAPMRPDMSTLVLAVVAFRDPGLPWFPVLAGWLVKVFYQD